MPAAHLADRGVVRVSGPDAKTFLDGLLTCALDGLSPEHPRFGALLSPQGKVHFDFILFEAPQEAGDGLFFDILKVHAAEFIKRLSFYRLRAKVEIADLSDALCVVAGFDAPAPEAQAGLVGPDPRLKELGWRAILACEDAAEFADTPESAWHARRISLGVPEGGRDFLFGEAFPHEALMDQLNGVDFDKGCFVGQEVVSRMEHRSSARTRIVPVVYEGGIATERGAEIVAGEKRLGTAGTGADGRGLAMIRLDRAALALSEGETPLAGGIRIKIEKPPFARFDWPLE